MKTALILLTVCAVCLTGCGFEMNAAPTRDTSAEATAVFKSARATNTALARLASSEPTEAPTATPRPKRTPTAGDQAVRLPANYRLYTSKLHRYQIGYPRGWYARANKQYRMDGFAPRSSTGVSIFVMGEVLPRGKRVDPEVYLRTVLGYMELDPDDVRRDGKVPAGSTGKALLVSWADKSRSERVTQAVWVSGSRAWVAWLSTPSDGHETYLDTLKTMLSTFQRPAGSAGADDIVQ